MTSEQEPLAALQSNEVLHLRLRKKYYSEAPSFIRTIESAMESVIQLFGSTQYQQGVGIDVDGLFPEGQRV